MKLLGLDVGTVRIGVATSDIMQIIASPYEVYKRRTPYLDTRYIVELAEKLEAEKIVFGLPLKLDGTEGDSAKMARDLAQRVSEQTSLPIVFQDERLSTVSAERILIETGNRRDKRKDKIDAIAATIILQNYIDKVK
ncbi:MAG: Holliday junction resolvase RuvX [Clostridia bacterium]|nr:Holliday junction resolvase RuvX [Clostridia bacterium]